MPTSTPGKGSRNGFTLIEFSVVLFVLGLVLWLVAPRLGSLGTPGRNAVFREIAAGSEDAFDTALFAKQEVRLVIDPAAGTFAFRTEGGGADTLPHRPFGETLSVTGIRLNGEDRPPDVVTEIRYLPGGKVPEARIFIKEAGAEGKPSLWTLRLSPVDGTVEVLEGTVADDA
jgi:prepilin-type N-terminal cleavage/methylation domain-containing protein